MGEEREDPRALRREFPTGPGVRMRAGTKLIPRQLAAAGPTRAARALVRGLDAVETTHDLCAWCWQNTWAISNLDTCDGEQDKAAGGTAFTAVG